ncbi:unnamed protein product [Brassica oleracea var. botrytis]
MERSNHKEEKVQDQAQPSQPFLVELMETQGELPKEIEEDVRMQEVATEDLEEKKHMEDMKGKDRVTGEMEKRQGTRKKAVKPSLGAAASNTLKMAQLMAAKRTVAKPGIRHGDHSKGA